MGSQEYKKGSQEHPKGSQEHQKGTQEHPNGKKCFKAFKYIARFPFLLGKVFLGGPGGLWGAVSLEKTSQIALKLSCALSRRFLRRSWGLFVPLGAVLGGLGVVLGRSLGGLGAVLGGQIGTALGDKSTKNPINI